MNEVKIAERVRGVVAEHLGIDLDPTLELNDHDDLIMDHGADDLDLIALAMKLEEEFGVELSDETLQQYRTVSKCIELVIEGMRQDA